MTPDELKALTVEELQALKGQVEYEMSRRQTLADIPEKMDVLATTFLAYSGVERGSAWGQPAGSHDAYPLGWQVEYNGKKWESLVRSNVWEPGTSGWREVTEPGAEPAAWVQPTGAHDAYQAGDKVTHNGKVWTSEAEANVWVPGEHGWVTPADPEPTPVVDAQPAPATWVQPQGGHDSYSAGALVTHNGAIYESSVSGNVWEPGVYGWVKV